LRALCVFPMAEQPATASPRWPYVFASGLAMGSADVVPGVSGGTMAFILGIYGQLLEAITGFDLELLALLRRGDWPAAAARIHLGFLVPLLAGLLGSVLLLVRPITWLYEHQPVLLFAFFFGLIVGSIVLIARHAHWGLPHDPFTLFWSGAVAIMAMILPGVSGSFLLLVLGQYQHVMESVKGLEFGTLIPFALGCITGLLLFVRLLRWLLSRWHGQAVALLMGFMVGSLWKIWPFRTILESSVNAKGKLVVLRDALAAPADGSQLAVALLLMGAGVLLVTGLEQVQQRIGAAEMGG
jgi:putative membrane protein